MWRPFAFLSAAILSLAPLARADDRPAFHAEIGLGSERSPGWTPIRVFVSGGDRAIDGTVVLEHDQDSTQRARLVAPFATTPGKETAVELVAFLPDSLYSLRISLVDARGVPLGSVRCSISPNAGELPLPPEIPRASCRILAVGGNSIRTAFADRSLVSDTRLSFSSITPEGEPRVDSWSNFNTRGGPAVFSAPVDALPTQRVAYEQVDAVVVSGDQAANADPRAVEAILGWVRHGGRLVIVADDATPSWRAWLPSGPEGDLVALDEPRAIAPPDALRSLHGPELIPMIMENPQADEEPGADETPDEAAKPEAPSASNLELPPVAESFPARVVTLTDRARRDGWRLRWAIDGSRGIIAEGPVEHGWVTIVGVDPRATCSLLSRAAQLRVWPAVLGNALSDAVEEFMNINEYSPREPALAAAIELVASGVPPERGAFIAIIGLMIALALALGPIDFFGLKALTMRHRSWATALAWIGVASALAYVGPVLVRVSGSRFARFECVDRVVNPDDALGAPGRAAIIGVTGHYAGTSETIALEHEHADAWWHGISADAFYGRTRGAGPVITIVQPPGGLAGPPSSGRLESFTVGLWTFRTFVDDADGVVPYTGRAWRGEDGRWNVSLAGLAPEARVEDLALRTREGWRPMQDEGGLWVQSQAPIEPDAWHADQDLEFKSTRVLNDPRPLMHALDPLVRREPALEARLETGRWAAIHAVVHDSSPNPRASSVADQSRILLLRLQVPIDASETPAPAVPGDAP